MGENYQALLEDHKRQLFSKGLAERGYFRSSGLMKDSVVSSDETVYLTYLGDEDESLDLSSASWDSTIERGCSTLVVVLKMGESGCRVIESRITIGKAGDQTNGDLVTTNITSALTQFYSASEQRVLLSSNPKSIKQTPYGMKLSIVRIPKGHGCGSTNYEINVTQVPGMSETCGLLRMQ